MWALRNGTICLCLAVIFLVADLSLGAEGKVKGAAKSKAPDKVVIFEDDFESGTLDKWTGHGRGVGIVGAAGSRACRIDSARGNLLLKLPDDKLSHKRLRITCRYRLTDFTPGPGRNPFPRMSVTWTDTYYSKGRKAYGGGSFRPAKDPNEWALYESVEDFTRGVGDARLRIAFQRAKGVLLIDDVRMVAAPQTLIPIRGYKRLKRGKLIFEENFDTDLSEWVHEGVGTAEVKDGRLHVFVTPDHKETRGQNLWLKRKLPPDFIAEMLVRPIAPKPEEKVTCNLLYFFSATRKGGNLLGTIKERDGSYGAYIGRNAIVPCYTLTWYRMNDPHFVIARRNPGWGELARNFPAEPTPGKDHKIVIEKRGGEILLVEDGVPVLLARDEQKPLGAGYFALRSWHCKASYDYVRFYAVEGEAK